MAAYHRPLAIQVIGQHASTAASDLHNPGILRRQRRAAWQYLKGLSAPPCAKLLVRVVGFDDGARAASYHANSCLSAGLAYAIEATKDWGRMPLMHARLMKLSDDISGLRLTDPSQKWSEATGYSLGVWVQWLETVVRHRGVRPSDVWFRSAMAHDPAISSDWQSLRKGPRYLREIIGDGARARVASSLALDDGGWLLEYLGSNAGERTGPAFATKQLSRLMERHNSERAKSGSYVTGLEWVVRLQAALPDDGFDPRSSEWTDLEILRQILIPLLKFGTDETRLDHLHPGNVLISAAWLDKRPGDGTNARWTWESWRHAMRQSKDGVRLTKVAIQDYRRQPRLGPDQNDLLSVWEARLRGCGLLLIGLIARDFALPSHWNVEGGERDTATFLRALLEEVPVSSHTLAILEASLLPRSSETARMRLTPWAFFGIKKVEVINDTRSDPPILRGVADLIKAIERAQAVLERGQISVLNHAPRQLIPMNVRQLKRTAEPVVEQDVDQ